MHTPRSRAAHKMNPENNNQRHKHYNWLDKNIVAIGSTANTTSGVPFCVYAGTSSTTGMIARIKMI